MRKWRHFRMIQACCLLGALGALEIIEMRRKALQDLPTRFRDLHSTLRAGVSDSAVVSVCMSKLCFQFCLRDAFLALILLDFSLLTETTGRQNLLHGFSSESPPREWCEQTETLMTCLDDNTEAGC